MQLQYRGPTCRAFCTEGASLVLFSTFLWSRANTFAFASQQNVRAIIVTCTCTKTETFDGIVIQPPMLELESGGSALTPSV